MAKSKTQTKKTYRPSMTQIVFVVLTLVIVLSFVLSLFVKL
jgi:hypothetical protein